MGAHDHLLSSWNDTATRQAIVRYVESVTQEGGDSFVAPEERVAIFDNDGTLWCEKPMPIQLDWTIRQMGELAAKDPSLREQQPWKAAHEKDLHWMGAAMVKHYHGDDSDVHLLMAAIPRVLGGMTVEAYQASVASFFETATHSTLGRPYRSCGYQPRLPSSLRWTSDDVE